MRLRAKTDLSTVYYNLASLAHQEKQYVRAGELFQKSVGIDEQIVQESPTTAHWDTLADGYYLLGCRADLYHLTEYARAFLEQAAPSDRPLRTGSGFSGSGAKISGGHKNVDVTACSVARSLPSYFPSRSLRRKYLYAKVPNTSA